MFDPGYPSGSQSNRRHISQVGGPQSSSRGSSSSCKIPVARNHQSYRSPESGTEMQRSDIRETSLDWKDYRSFGRLPERLRPVLTKASARSSDSIGSSTLQTYEATDIQRALHQPTALRSEFAGCPVSRGIDEHSSANGQELLEVGALTKIYQFPAELGYGKRVEHWEAEPGTFASSTAEPSNATVSMLQRLEAAERSNAVRDARLQAAERAISVDSRPLSASSLICQPPCPKRRRTWLLNAIVAMSMNRLPRWTSMVWTTSIPTQSISACCLIRCWLPYTASFLFQRCSWDRPFWLMASMTRLG